MVARARRIVTRRHVVFTISLLIGIGIIGYRQHRIEVERLPAFPYGEIRIAIDASFPPFALADELGMAGLEIDLGFALSEQLNAPVRFINMGSDGLYDALEADHADIAISALIPEAWRLGDVIYTSPYFDAGLVLVVNSVSEIDEMKDLAGLTLAYEFGSHADTEARLWLRRITPFEVQPYELPEHALDAVRLNLADAALVDAVTARLYLANKTDWQAKSHYVTHIPYAIAVDFYKPETYLAVEKALIEILKNGKMDEIIRQWL